MPFKNFGISSWWQRHGSHRAGFAGIIALYVVTMVGIVVYTLVTFHSQRSDAMIIDLAGRQRMLNTRHLMQILLVSQGGTADYRYTRSILHQTLNALTHGGEAVIDLGEEKTEILPPAPTQAIRQKLESQKNLIQKFTAEADTFLQLAPTDPSYPKALEDLRSLYVMLHAVADDAVKMLSRESRAKVTDMLQGQIVVAFMVGILGVLLTHQVTRANRDREREMLERQKAQEELRRSQAQVLHALRQSDALKSALLSSVSHELRTPLTSIKAMASRALNQSQDSPRIRRDEYLVSINQEIDHLTRLVNNLLDMSRIEAGTLKPQRDWELLEDLVEGAIASLKQSVETRELRLDLEDDLPPMFVDGIQVQQVLANLLDNAVKYSFEGSAISLKIHRQGDGVEIRVSNRGEGISKENIPHVFERFYRIPSKREPNIRGTGLGLAICQSLIEAHGGRIWVESIPGHTTTFVFTLPLKPAIPEHVPSGTTSREAPPHD